MAQANGKPAQTVGGIGAIVPATPWRAPAPKSPVYRFCAAQVHAQGPRQGLTFLPPRARWLRDLRGRTLSELEALVRPAWNPATCRWTELLTGYQRGTVLLQTCRDKLQAVEDQIGFSMRVFSNPGKPHDRRTFDLEPGVRAAWLQVGKALDGWITVGPELGPTMGLLPNWWAMRRRPGWWRAPAPLLVLAAHALAGL